MTSPHAPDSRSSLLHWLPFDGLQAGVSWLRRLAFSSERPGGSALQVEADPPTLREVFGRQHFTPNWKLSYYYYGEALNMRRVVYGDPSERKAPPRTPSSAPIEWWQIHVRGFSGPLATENGPNIGPDGVALMAHVEPEPVAHPEAHTDGTGLLIEPGERIAAMVLRRAGFEPDHVQLASPTEEASIDTQRPPQSH